MLDWQIRGMKLHRKQNTHTHTYAYIYIYSLTSLSTEKKRVRFDINQYNIIPKSNSELTQGGGLGPIPSWKRGRAPPSN